MKPYERIFLCILGQVIGPSSHPNSVQQTLAGRTYYTRLEEYADVNTRVTSYLLLAAFGEIA
jgi:hypothetical protein